MSPDQQVERLTAALELVAALDAKRDAHLGRARLSGLEKSCVGCVAALALGRSADTADAADFRAALTNLTSPSSEPSGLRSP